MPKGTYDFSCARGRKCRPRPKMETTITITVNGENRAVNGEATVADLLRELGLNARRVALERNLEILPRPKWQETRVAEGDRYEIVQFVGGG
jgi:thiamine biosynthesis protein ThiS